MVARAYGIDPTCTADHFGWPLRHVQAALNYDMAFPKEIERAIEDNSAMTETTLKRLLPQIETLSVPAPGSGSERGGDQSAS